MRKRILVIDDDVDSLQIISEILVYEGFDVNSFTAAEAIIPMLKAYKPDLLLLDYKLPGKTGGELCREVKACTLTARLPVVLASVYPDVLNSADQFCCDAFVAKPFDMYAIVTKVIELINLAALPVRFDPN